MSNVDQMLEQRQQEKNDALIAGAKYMRRQVLSDVLPVRLNLRHTTTLSDDQAALLQALEIEAARTAIKTVGSLAKINEVDHLGGGLDLIGALLMTLLLTDYEKVDYTIENAHTSIGYYSALAALGYLNPTWVQDRFRRGLDIAGHVAWVPGGTQLNGGRLGIMIPAAVGYALGKKANHGTSAWVLCHCGDAGWISGQALNGFNAADLHAAPITFVMHRNGIQLSGSNQSIMDKDPRPIVASMGVSIIETPSLHDPSGLFAAYREAFALAQQGRPSLIYPTGFGSDSDRVENLTSFGERYDISAETKAFAKSQQVGMDTHVWIPGALMSYRDAQAMLECLFLVNDLPGGKAHHDGHLKGRDVPALLKSRLLTLTDKQSMALSSVRESERQADGHGGPASAWIREPHTTGR